MAIIQSRKENVPEEMGEAGAVWRAKLLLLCWWAGVSKGFPQRYRVEILAKGHFRQRKP